MLIKILLCIAIACLLWESNIYWVILGVSVLVALSAIATGLIDKLRSDNESRD